MERDNEADENAPEIRKKTKWNLLRNVVRAVTLFKSHEANEANDLDILVNEINQIPTDKIYRLKRRMTQENSAYVVALKDLRREQSLHRCVERGNPEDLDTIKLEIEQDPYRLLRNSTHPLALINKRNAQGQTPMYIACKNGNLEVVILLLEENADYLLSSMVDSEEESNLEVAVRWGHHKVAQILLKKNWPKIILNKARKLFINPEMEELFRHITKKKKAFCCF